MTNDFFAVVGNLFISWPALMLLTASTLTRAPVFTILIVCDLLTSECIWWIWLFDILIQSRQACKSHTWNYLHYILSAYKRPPISVQDLGLCCALPHQKTMDSFKVNTRLQKWCENKNVGRWKIWHWAPSRKLNLSNCQYQEELDGTRMKTCQLEIFESNSPWPISCDTVLVVVTFP